MEQAYIDRLQEMEKQASELHYLITELLTTAQVSTDPENEAGEAIAAYFTGEEGQAELDAVSGHIEYAIIRLNDLQATVDSIG